MTDKIEVQNVGQPGKTYRVDAAGSTRTPGDAEFTAIDQAFAAWQAVSDGCSDFRFERGPRCFVRT